MKSKNNLGKITDLTPLLDVVLILLFALFLNVSFQQQTTKAQNQDLSRQLSDIKQQLEQSNSQTESLEQSLALIQQQSDELTKAVAVWLTKNKVVNQNQNVDQVKQLFDADVAGKSLAQLDRLAKSYFFVEVEIDTDRNHEVKINGQSTGIQLDFEARTETSLLEQAEKELYHRLDQVLERRQGGYEFALITLTDDGKSYRYAYDLTWQVINRLQKDNKNYKVFKMQYLDYSSQ